MLAAVLIPGTGYTTQGPLFDLAEIAVTALKGLSSLWSGCSRPDGPP